MPDATATPSVPHPAGQVVLLDDRQGVKEARISLAAIAAQLSKKPASGFGMGSRVWRFAPAAVARERPPAPDDVFYALKWVHLSDPVRARHLPQE